MIKRTMDIVCSFIGLLVLSPLLILVSLLIFLYDRHNPFFISERIGKGGKPFKLYKFRSMVPNAKSLGGDSTAADDKRITPIGHFIRKYKLDELLQLVNVLKGDMSLVGPRPNVGWAVDGYTEEEKRLITIRPGITDFASIVFADEGEILAGSADPDGDYDRLIRPWKSRLGLLYVDNNSPWLDLVLIFVTVVGIVDRERALRVVSGLVRSYSDDNELSVVARRSRVIKIVGDSL